MRAAGGKGEPTSWVTTLTLSPVRSDVTAVDVSVKPAGYLSSALETRSLKLASGGPSQDVLGHGGVPPAGLADVGFPFVHDLAVVVERQFVLGALAVAPGPLEGDEGRGRGAGAGDVLRPA